MQNPLRYLMPLLSLAAALPASRAADESKPVLKEEKQTVRVLSSRDDGAPDRGGARIERRFGPARAADMGEKETVTFLGVETAPISPTLTAQLGLAEGTGLVVAHVVPGSPAAGVLKEHDVLLKLDDQVLIEQRQLAVLVRNHREGDEVTLTYLRGGKQATAKVKLDKHEVPKMAMQFNQAGPGIDFGGGSFGRGFVGGEFDLLTPNPNGPQNSEMFERLLPMMEGVKAPGVRRLQMGRPVGPGPGPGERNISVTVNTANSHLVLDDDQGSIELTIKEGHKDLIAKNAKGEQVFAGPVNTTEERRALPAEVRKRLEGLEDSTQFSFRPDGDFKAETKIVRPRGQGIAFPPPASGELIRPSPVF